VVSISPETRVTSTNTTLIARLSSAGQVEEATSQITSSRISSARQIYRSLYTSTFPIKNSHVLRSAERGGQNPLMIILSLQKRHREFWLCEYRIRKIFPHQTDVFHSICYLLECNLFPETFLPIRKSFSCLEQISSELTIPSLAVRCSANVVYETTSCSNQIPVQTAGNL
jgi:hypothetical protein